MALTAIAVPAVHAETPAERCTRETNAYNQTWKQAWVLAHPGTTIDDAPAPNPPYICHSGDDGGSAPTITAPSTTETPTNSATATSEAPPTGVETTSNGPDLEPPASTSSPADNVDAGQPTIGSAETSDEIRKLTDISVRNFNIAIDTLRRQLIRLATQNGETYQQTLDGSWSNAVRAVRYVSGPTIGSGSGDVDSNECGQPANAEVGQARQPGDFFYSDSCTGGGTATRGHTLNHGHNGLFTTNRATVEASNDKGVHAVPEAYQSLRLNPRKYAVNDASSGERSNAVAYGLSKVGLGYSYNYVGNRQGGPGVGSFNCSQLVWAAYYEPTHETDHVIDVDADEDTWHGRVGNNAVYPKDLIQSKHVTSY
ncbi:hypothetical protein GIY30_23800 [Gordonia sp. HNM0687]|uniref:Uncharacterized protein n=1 Tax=Gordonia mangrovi TaxID=2665643 RepID=A0A6L7GWQ2_9ACTN|nr:hypothetical protein [Gordonia mangrovi]MXP24350.1 hypothetical protein [Gordonia mangrovi]UVF80027.1 hypothetical protein NWF22_09475 [Gordonia mangrovi]